MFSGQTLFHLEPSTNQNLSVDHYFIFLCLKGNGLLLNPKAVLLEEPWAQGDGRREPRGAAPWAAAGCLACPMGSVPLLPLPWEQSGCLGDGDGGGDRDGWAQQRVSLQELGLVMLRAVSPAWGWLQALPFLEAPGAPMPSGTPASCPQTTAQVVGCHHGGEFEQSQRWAAGQGLAQCPLCRSPIPQWNPESSLLPSFPVWRLMFKQHLSYKSLSEAFLRTNS